LTLAYSSYGRNGFVGVGWALSGFSQIERASPGRGTPRFDANDIYLLDGQDLVPCVGGSLSPSCTTGGTHSTKIESYLRISWSQASNSWSVWSKNGTKTTYSSIYSTPSGTLIWGQTQRLDTHGNSVSFTWASDNGDSYPDAVVFGPYRVRLFRELRPDLLTFAAGSASTLRTTRYRLKSILVESQNVPLRAYQLTYTQSAATAASLLAAVTQYGKDVVISGSGAISGGTALPPQTFVYQGGPDSRRFTTWATDSSEPPPGGLPGDPLVTGTGSDGALTVTNGQTVLVDSVRSPLVANATAGSSTITVASGTGFAAGQEVLVIQTTGPSAGVFETRAIGWVAGNTLTLTAVLAHDFATTGSSKAQVIRVPHYTSVAVQSGGTLSASPWDGSTGGVLFFRATGAVTVASGGSLTVAGRGFPGGSGGAVSGVIYNGSNGGYGGSGDAISNHCPPYQDIGQVGWCDSCDYWPCQAVEAQHGSAAQTGSGWAVAAGRQGRGCNNPNWCFGGNGGAGGVGGFAGGAANSGAVGLGPGGGSSGSGGVNIGISSALLFGGSGGGGNGGAQGTGGGGGGGGGGGVHRYYGGSGNPGSGGGSGGRGGAGGNGGASGGIIVVTAQSVVVQGTVSAAGAAGLAASAGLAGEGGGNGGTGGAGASNPYGNASGAQGQGGKGAAGGTGGNGGGGGAGGTIYLRASQIDTTSGTVVVAGGPGGAGAAGGPGGPGGLGPATVGPGSSGASGQAGTQGGTGRYISLTF
jgi:hypothetical protein